ncbi:hypothetical protein D3C81_1527350 [compost metagenome]
MVAGDLAIGIGVGTALLQQGQVGEQVALQGAVVLVGAKIDNVLRVPETTGGKAWMVMAQAVRFGVKAQACQCGAQAAEIEAVRPVGTGETGHQCIAFGGVLALPGQPALHRRRVGELMERRSIARQVQHYQRLAGVTDLHDASGNVAVDIEHA